MHELLHGDPVAVVVAYLRTTGLALALRRPGGTWRDVPLWATGPSGEDRR